MNTVEIENLSKSFGKNTVLNEINLEIEQGEVFGFIGPNGAGKSTTIRILLGLLKATSGEARIFGKDAWKESVDPLT